MKEPSTSETFKVLLEIKSEDAEILHKASFQLRSQGLITRLGIKPVVNLLLKSAVQKLKAQQN